MSQRAVIFDIDGTLSDPTHRLHHVQNGAKNWPAFFDAMGEDPVHEPIRDLLWLLFDKNVKIILVSGRPDTHRIQTETWLEQHRVLYHELHMRAAGDYRADHIVKGRILDHLLSEDNEIMLVIDDRQSVVDMWRERGLTCLQCRPDNSTPLPGADGELTLLIGPAGAGKSTWLNSQRAAQEFGIRHTHVISSDAIRADLCGDFRDQSKNAQVFEALHAMVAARLSNGLPTVVDATNVRRKSRMALVKLTSPSAPIRYIVLNRPMAAKRKTADWRAKLPTDVMAKYEQVFNSNLKDILAGDGLPNVTVFDLRADLAAEAAA